MDGASKFVRGDAIAGLLVVFINVLGGIIIGVAQQGMPFMDGRQRPIPLLTVGDGLVTQVPALIVLNRGRPSRLKRGRLRRRRQGDGQAILALSARRSVWPAASCCCWR